MKIQEYFLTATIGDIIKTNANGEITTPETYTMEIIGIHDNILIARLTEAKEREKLQGKYNLDGWEMYIDYLPETTFFEVVKKAEVKETNKKVFSIEVEDNRTDLSIVMKIPDEIENYYKALTQGKTTKSKNWIDAQGLPLDFYKLTPELIEAEKQIDSSIFSEYGSTLMKNGKINTAILRSVGASKGIKISASSLSISSSTDLDSYVKRLGEFIRRLWERSIAKQKVKCVINYEIQS